MYFLEYTCIDAPMPTGMPLFWSCLGIIMDLKKRIMFQYLVIVCYHAWKCYNLNQSMSYHALGIFMVLLWFWLYIRFGLLHWPTQYTTKWLCHSPVIMHMPLFFEIYSRAWICLYIHEPTDCWSLLLHDVAVMNLDHPYASHALGSNCLLLLITLPCLYPCYCRCLNPVTCILTHLMVTATTSFIIWPYTCLLSTNLA